MSTESGPKASKGTLTGLKKLLKYVRRRECYVSRGQRLKASPSIERMQSGLAAAKAREVKAKTVKRREALEEVISGVLKVKN